MVAYFIRLVRRRWLFTALMVTATVAGRGQDFHLESVGARFGFSPVGTAKDFHQAEAFMNWDLPWDWNMGRDWHLQPRLDASAGWLGDAHLGSFVGTAGPSFWVGKVNFPLSFEGGSSPTLLSRHSFTQEDFGDLFQFTSHIGLNYDITKHLRAGYRFQHMSNAGLSNSNPGLNLHVLSLSYLF